MTDRGTTLSTDRYAKHNLRSLHQDHAFWFALIAGPTFWLGLEQFIPAAFDLQKILDQWQQYILLVGLYPIFEEWLFRGLLQPQLLIFRGGRAVLFGISGANVITTVIFLSLHFFSHPHLWAILVSIPSLIFGGFRDRYQSVIPAILLHCFYNIGYFIFFQAV